MNQTPLHDATSGAGAVFGERDGWQVPLHFGNPEAEYRAAREGAALFDLSPTGKVEVAGADSQAFLHRICTNDLRELPVGAGVEAFFANATARALFYVHVYHVLLHDGRDGWWIDVAPGRAEALIKHLDRYAISDAVEFADRTADFAVIRLAGPKARAVLEKALGEEVPDLGPLQHMVRTFGAKAHANVRRHEPLALPGYDIVCLKSLAPEVWEQLTRAGATPAGAEAHEILRVEAGTPAFGKDLDADRFIAEVGRIPQTISYTKGCFPGQEPVVMARDRGAVQRSLLGLRVSGPEIVPAGSKVFREGKEIGVTTSSVISPDAGVVALAYLRRGNQDAGTAVEVESNGEKRPAEVSALPITAIRS